MHIPVLIEPIGDGRFRGRIGDPLSLTTEAATRAEATQSAHQEHAHQGSTRATAVIELCGVSELMSSRPVSPRC
jgi:diphthamide biosynthesis methyltransferase